MSKVILSMSMSLDGFIAGENISPQNPMGDDGPRLHEWLFDKKTDVDAKISAETFATSGAVIVGGRTYIIAIHDAWGGTSPFPMPAFVVCQKRPEEKDIVEGFTFVTDGIEATLAQAREAAGDKNVWVMGGANIAQQYLKAGLLDELHIQIAPVLLARGVRLFENFGTECVALEANGVAQTPGATHLTFVIKK